MTKQSPKVFFMLGVSFFLFGAYLLFLRFNPNHVSFHEVPETQVSTTQTAQPAEITISSAHIDLPVIPGKITNNTWDVTTQGISFLSSSPIPGQKGNSILYGHNWTSLLGPLVRVRPGDDITITYADNSIKHFRVKTITRVNPTDIQILNPSEDQRITVYTCTGFLDSKRLVVVATLNS